MAMIKCSECGAEISDQAKSCPHCGAKQKIKKPLYKRPWFIVLAVIIILSAISSSKETGHSNVGTSSTAGRTASSVAAASKEPSRDTKESSSVSVASSEASQSKNALELQGEVTVEKDTFATYFVGVVVNNKSRDLTYVQITFNLYDKEGNLVGTALDNINNLKSGGTWKFKAMAFCDNDEIAGWELDSITGY